MKSMFPRRSHPLLSVVALVAIASSLHAADARIADVKADGSTLVFEPKAAYERLLVSVHRPDGSVLRMELSGQSRSTLDAQSVEGLALANGRYRLEINAVPQVDPALRAALAAARAAGDDSVQAHMEREGKLPPIPPTQFGSFTVSGGHVSLTDPTPESGGPIEDQDQTTRDQVVPDDLIVQGSSCVGVDCVNNEDFHGGFDTIKLKENNLRIRFEDTSTDPTRASNDWQLVANDSAAGGLNKFSIEDITNSRVPFTIEAGNLTADSIYVDSSGKVGFHQTSPLLDLHITTSNTPGLRLEQTNAGGFTAQTWDIAGNEANFFVRDVTSGSRLPFRIRPGAPTSSIDISADGDVGFGHGSPATQLHVRTTDGDTQLRVEEANNSAPAERTLLELRNNGPVNLILRNVDPTPDPNDANNPPGVRATWQLGFTDAGLTIARPGSGGEDLLLRNDGGLEVGPGPSRVFVLDPSGNLEIQGALTESSSVDLKENFATVDGQKLLASLARLPIQQWNYKADADEVRHVGPTAQDFRRAFGLGRDEKHIAPIDTGGISLAAIQALYALLQQRDQQVQELQTQNAELAKRLEALEALVRKQTQTH